jgi:GNAT superfamily N-acetyltransferase
MGARCAAFRLIAIRRALQKQGHGTRLLALAEQLVAELGCAQVTIQSAKDAVPFYLKNGYATGDWFDIITPLRETVCVGKVLMPALLGERGGRHQAIY